MENKINVQDLMRLQPGENYTVFQGDPVPGASFYIEPEEKTCQHPLIINRYITINPPKLERIRKLMPRTAQRRLPTPENVSKIIGVLTSKPSKRRKKTTTEPRRVVDTFQQRLANRQEALNLQTRFDLDFAGRENAIIEEAFDIIRTTTQKERTIRYITLNQPEDNNTLATETTMPSELILRDIALPDISVPDRHSLQQKKGKSWATPDVPEGIRHHQGKRSDH